MKPKRNLDLALLQADRDYLLEMLALIEMETRRGGQLTLIEINDLAKVALEQHFKNVTGAK